MRVSRRYRRPAISALQLVVVLAILLFGMAFLFPIITRVREAAARTQSINNLKQFALAAHSYHDSYKFFPPAVGERANQKGPAHFHLLPFLDQQQVQQNAQGAVWKNGAYGTVLEVFLDPRDSSLPGHVYKNWLATTNYPVNWMVFKDGNTRFNNLTDGSSNTLMNAQRYQSCNGQPTAWGYPSIYTWAPIFAYYNESTFQSGPTQEACDPTRPQAIGRDIQASLCDGTVRTFTPNLSATTWSLLCDPNDGMTLPADAFD